MRWPWVPRSTADMIERRRVSEAGAAAERIAELESRARRDEQRYDALLEKYHAIARPRRLSKPETPAPATPAAPQRPAEVQAALDGAGRGQPHDVRSAMAARADRLLADEVPPKEVAQRIWRGEEVGL